MTGSHIAVFEIPATGHINPALGLCAELVKRGHRVTFPTGDEYEARVRKTGATPILIRSVKASDTLGLTGIFDRMQIDDPNWWPACASVLYPWFMLSAAATVVQLRNVYDQDPPDLILYDRLAFAGRIIGRRLNVPLIQIYPHFAYYQRSLFREKGVSENPEPMLALAKLLDTFLSAYGIHEEGSLWHTEARNIYFIPREFQFSSEWFDERSRFVGACLNRPFELAWNAARPGAPIVLISDMVGAGTGFFDVFVDALRTLNVRVILSIGQDADAGSLQDLPSNFEINRDASHLEILPHAALSICQGGMGTTLEALYHGVPVIALPLTRFHEEVTYRTVELGLGYSLPRLRATSKMIRECVQLALTDAAMVRRVKNMQRVFGASNGAKLAGDCVEEILASRRGRS